MVEEEGKHLGWQSWNQVIEAAHELESLLEGERSDKGYRFDDYNQHLKVQ